MPSAFLWYPWPAQSFMDLEWERMAAHWWLSLLWCGTGPGAAEPARSLVPVPPPLC